MTTPGSLEPVLVGRATEMALVTSAFERAIRSRQPLGLLVTGEAGIGKSRLLRETIASLDPAAWRVAEGYALPGQGVPPYFAVGRAFRRLARLAQSEPMNQFATDNFGSEAGADAGAAGSAGGQLRLLDALAAHIESATADQPTLIVLDDMQWAGKADWAAVAHLLRSVQGPLVLLLAARDAGLWDASSPALDSLLDLNRQRLIIDVRLGQLAPAAIQELCRATLGHPVAAPVLEAVIARTDGNPFLVEELLGQYVHAGFILLSGDEFAFADGTATGAVMPATVQQGTRQLVDGLGESARDLLELAAIAGRQFSEDLLVRARPGDEAPVGTLRLAATAGLVTAMPAGEWSFRHDLVREAIIASIDPAHRRTLHRQVAVALGSAGPAVDAAANLARTAALAHHWREAGERLLAARAAHDASLAAERAFAPDEALDWARAAYDLAANGETTDADLLAAALVRLGDAEVARGLYIEAEQTAERLRAHAGTMASPSLTGQAWLRLGLVARRREDNARAASAFATALEILERIPGEGTNVARALIEMASIAGLTLAEYGSADEYASRALDLARALGDGGLEAEALVALANSRTRSEGPVAARPMLTEALARAESAGHVHLAIEIAAGLSNNHYWSGELRKSEAFARKRLELATRAHDIFGLRHGHSWLALVTSSMGNWDEATALLAEAEPLLARLASPEPLGFIRVITAFIHFRTGNDDQACAAIAEAMTLLDPLGDGTLLWYGSLAARIYLAAGRTADALREIERQENRLAAVPPSALPARSARAALLPACLDLGDVASARRHAAELADFPGDFHWSPVRLSLALVSAAEGNRDAALALLAEAEEQARREGQRPDLGSILLARAELLPPGTGRSGALSSAIEVFRDLGMRRDLARAEALLESPRPHALPGGMTAREAEVAALVGRGLTNREIAAQLVISERTVVNHVANIFAKVGVENRAGLAAFAVRSGLVDPA